MNITSSAPSAFGFLKRLLLLLALILGLGTSLVQAAPAYTTLTDAQLQAIATIISNAAAANPSYDPYAVVQTQTAGIDPATAATYASKIVGYLPENQQASLAGRIGVGVAWNCPARLTEILQALISNSEAVRKNASQVVYYLAKAGGFDSSTFASVLNNAMLNNHEMIVQAGSIINAMLSGISTHTADSVSNRASQMADLAAIASANLAVVDDRGKYTLDKYIALQKVQVNLANSLLSLGASQAEVGNAVALYVWHLKQSLQGSGSSSSQIALALDSATKNLLAVFPPTYAATVSTAISAAISATTIPVTDTGTVVPPETPSTP